MSHLVGNPEDRFSHVAAQVITMSFFEKNSLPGFGTRSDTNLPVQSQKQDGSLKKKRDFAIYGAKTKALIRCAVTAQLISAFVFAYAVGLCM